MKRNSRLPELFTSGSLTVRGKSILIGLFLVGALSLCGIKYLSTREVINQDIPTSNSSETVTPTLAENQLVSSSQHIATISDKIGLLVNGYYISESSISSYSVVGVGFSGKVDDGVAVLFTDGTANANYWLTKFISRFTGSECDYISQPSGTLTVRRSK